MTGITLSRGNAGRHLNVLHWQCRCKTAVGGESPENTGARPPQVRPFSCALHRLVAPVSTAARAGEPSGSPVPVFRSLNPALGRHPRLRAGVAVVNRNTGANIMAGISLGAPSPDFALPRNEAKRMLRLVPASSRTRRNHGVFLFGGELASVYSSRREADGLGVILTVGQGPLTLTGAMTPTQARGMASALQAAAAAFEARQGGAA